MDKYASAQATKEALCKVFKLADCGLKVRRMTLAGDNSVRIEAFAPDMEKIRAHKVLAKAGLTVCESAKYNPRLVLHGVTKGNEC